jgi:NitT/TauT family transport system substrate-binding protein
MNRPAFRPCVVALVMGAVFIGHVPDTVAADTWRHGVVEAKGDSGFLFMVEDGGFAERRGIDLDINQFVSGNTPVRAIVAGELDSFDGSPVVALAAMAQGADIKILGCHWPVMTYTLFSRPEFPTPESLRGQTIGVSVPGSLPALFAIEALASVGLTKDDLIFANAGGSTNRFQAVVAGVVSATAASSEFEVIAENYGVHALLRGPTATPNLLRSCLMTSGRNISERRDLVERFVAARMESIAYALIHRDETIALSQKVAGLPADDQTSAFVYDEVIAYSAIDATMPLDIEKIQWALDLMIREDMIDGAHKAADFTDPSLREAALARLATH